MKGTFTCTAVLAVLLCSIAGCKMGQVPSRPTIPLVERIIGDAQSPEYKYLSQFDAGNPHGDIVLLDMPERAFSLSERLITCDERENVDGSAKSDALPDFAGERITTLIDLLYTPYDRFVSADNGGALREVTVRAALAAVDTACCLGPFDHENRSWKPFAKLVVLSSPYFAAYGGFDVDTLFRATGANVPVIYATEEMFASVMDQRPGAVNVGILSDPTTAKSGAYQTIFREFCRKRGSSYSTLSEFSTPDEVSDSVTMLSSGAVPDAFKLILDQYAKSGKAPALDALIVDDPTVSVDSLSVSYLRILNQPSEENAYYRKMLAKGFNIIDGAQVVTDACYRFLRNKNLFTHNISYPIAAAYITSPESKGFQLMDFDVNALPVEMSDKLRSIAPGTYKMYVQDQYHARGN